jgi:hypothetical protein
MRQDGNRACLPSSGDRQAAAPLNTEPHWPEGYIRVLREAGAQEKTIPYCMAWVRRFFAENPGRRRQDLGRTEIEVFLSGLAARQGVTNWLVQQARDSLELYYEQFRGIGLATRPDAPAVHARPPSVAKPVTPVPSVQKQPTVRSLPSPTVQETDAGYSAPAGSVKTNARSVLALSRPEAGTPPRSAVNSPGTRGQWG